MKWTEALGRFAIAVMDAINRKNKKDAASNSASTIANGERVRKSGKSFDELAERSERNSVE